ncbi:MAG: glycosyltransferase family 4 protein [Elusimicrobia bacterium]|nr:glycosyltransferase family 4 protein [Elusimicrobiota bacterium]
MRVIVSTHDSMAPIKGGGALRTLKCAEEFKRRGHDVIIIAPTDGIGELSGIKTHWLRAPNKQRSQILSSIKFNARLLRKFLQFAGSTDLIFVHNTIAAATIPFLRPFFRFRFILDVTDVHAEYLAAAKCNFIERLATPLVLWIEYWIIGSADKVVVVTRAMRDLLVAKGIPAARISVVYDAAEIDQISPEKDPGAEKAVLHLGTVDRQHGVDLFVRAVPYVAAKHPEAKFLIVGGGRELPNVMALARELGVYDKFLFTDYLPCEKAREYMRSAAIGVIPRLDTLPNRIVTTLKIYEYWAGGLVAVSSFMSGIAEIAEDGRDIMFFPSGDTRAMADTISRLLEDRELRERIAAGGLATVKKYTWAGTTPAIIDIALADDRS